MLHALVSLVTLDNRDESTILGLAERLAAGLDTHTLRETTPGGVAASVDGHDVVLGNASFLAALGISTDATGNWPQRLRQQGQSVLFVAVDGVASGLLGIQEDTMIDLRIAPVTRTLGGAAVRMLAYNGSIPGPTLRVRQGSQLLVNVINDGDVETTVHWHGLRLDNRYDGTALTQAPIPVGGRFTYRLAFPDAGAYWYHPHIREDYGQEMGLYGTIVVEPSDPEYWPPVHRELTLTLDDILIEDGRIAPFNRAYPTYTAMGRFGNVLLANGEPNLTLDARHGEVVRFYLTNTANTRVFNVAMRGATMKLVGGDSGRCEHERFVDGVVLAPSQRAVVDVRFDRPGQAALEHRTPERTYLLAQVAVSTERAEPMLDAAYALLRVDPSLAATRERLAADFRRPPDKTLSLIAEMDLGLAAGAGPAAYVCPMHPEVTSASADRCPRCGMKLVPAQLVEATAHGTGEHSHAGASGLPAGIEWEDDMVDVNRLTNPSNMRWTLRDRDAGTEGLSIDWRFRVGDRVKIRLINEMDSDHPMHHPFHIHGAGRFLVLSRDGVEEPNLAWTDTVLVPTGQTVDILLEITHPGVWMAHCHIAEHHESGMMFTFRVDPQASAEREE